MYSENDWWTYLAHHGVKGQKWGVKNGPPYPIKRDFPNITDRSKIEHIVETQHSGAPRDSTPNSIFDRISEARPDEGVTTRAFYGENGRKYKEIHTNDHGNRKEHSYGNNGEHVVEYLWNKDGSLKLKKQRELFDYERKENEDIL